VKIKGNEKYEFYSNQLQCHSTSHSTKPTQPITCAGQCDPTRPNPTHGWTQPMSISGCMTVSSNVNVYLCTCVQPVQVLIFTVSLCVCSILSLLMLLLSYIDKLEKNALDRGSMLHRPRYHTHLRWTQPLDTSSR